MARFVGLDVSQKLSSICVVDDIGAGFGVGNARPILGRSRGWSGGMREMMPGLGSRRADDAVARDELRARDLDVICLDARHASAALKMQMNKTDQNDAEGLAQIMRTGWYRSVHVKSLDAHRARALLGARAQLVGMTTRLSNHIGACSRRSACCLERCAGCRSTDASRRCLPTEMTWR